MNRYMYDCAVASFKALRDDVLDLKGFTENMEAYFVFEHDSVKSADNVLANINDVRNAMHGMMDVFYEYMNADLYAMIEDTNKILNDVQNIVEKYQYSELIRYWKANH